MKLLVVAVAVVALVASLLSIPLLFAHGDALATPCGSTQVDINAALATIRAIESGGNYEARSHLSSASGAYQFIDATWAGYGGFAEAWLAPPEVQDRKATDHVVSILSRHGGDIAAVPVVWYLGYVPDPGTAQWDQVPAAGNRLTPRQYQTAWLAQYRARLGVSTSDDAGSCPVGS